MATTLLAVGALGGPFLVTRGLIAHGALFLPALLVLFALFGAPILRLAMASGQVDNRLAGRDALQPMATLIRLALAAVLFVVGARACAWIATLTYFGERDGLLEYQGREVSLESASWSLQPGPALYVGAAALAVVTLMFVVTARKRQLAGLGWIGGWLLWLLVALFVLGLFAGYALPGAGALAAIVAQPRIAPLGTAEFWADAISAAMLAAGAQAGLLAAAGAGLPSRASVGREARILSASIGLVLVLAGLTGLVLLCALCAKQGVIPQPEHAAPGLLLLEVAPALGTDLFPGWPPELVPNARQIALTWQFLVALGAAFGVAALVCSRRWLPQHPRSPRAVAGYVAAAVVVLCVVIDHLRGVAAAAEPVTKVLPALLGLMHLTLARRAGPGMRVVSAAFGSGRPWLERLNVLAALQLARAGLVAGVVVLAIAYRPHSVTLAGLAIAFAVVWIGSLQGSPTRGSGVARVAAVAMLVLAPALFAATDRWQLVRDTLDNPDPHARLRFRREAESLRTARPGEPVPENVREVLAQRIDPPAPGGQATERNRDQVRDALGIALLFAPQDPELQRLERAQLQTDGVQPVRLDEALSEHAAGRPDSMREQAAAIARAIPGRELRRILEGSSDATTAAWTLALVADLQHAYGTAPPLTRDCRQYLMRRALTGRSLLRPDAFAGVVLLACLGLAAAALAIALALGLAPRDPQRPA